MLDKLEVICQLNGGSGDESQVRDFIAANIRADEVITDNLGNLLVFKKGRKTPKNKIMFAAHMDEVSFIVTHIDEDGFLSFDAVGGVNPSVVLGKALRLERGVLGVVGVKAIHQQSAEERKKIPEFSEMYLDI